MSLEDEKIITSIHIPKTAGISLKKFWVDLYGVENTFFLYPNKGGLYRASSEGTFRQPSPAMYQIKNILLSTEIGRLLYKVLYKNTKTKTATIDEKLLPVECKVVHGHFTPNHFKNTITDARLVTVLRDPLERAKSHYKYLEAHSKIMAIDPQYFIRGMSFEDFTMLPYQINFQSSYLNDLSLSSFDAVGTVNDLNCYCKKFDLNEKLQVAKLNTTIGEVFVSEQFKEKFKKMNRNDYDLYTEALSINASK